MSVKLEIFNDIVAQLLSKATSIKTRRLYNSQVENDSEESAFAYPACFIQFSNIGWEKTKQVAYNKNMTNEQAGTFNIILHIAFETLENETDSFDSLDTVIDEVYRAINGLKGTNYSSLWRINETQDDNHDNIIVWKIEFTCLANECAVSSTMVNASLTTAPTLVISTDLDIDNFTIRTGNGTI